MKLFRLFFPLVLASIIIVGCGSDDNDYSVGAGYPPQPAGTAGSANSNKGGDATRLEFPKTRTDNGSFVIVHNALLNSKTKETGVNYCVEWDPTIHAQRWCCYQMYGKMGSGTNASNTSRYYADNDGTGSINSQYPNDTCVAQQYHFTQDPFKGSGFDHGHICPSADRLGSKEANFQTFFLTNMMPQVNSFNAGIWAGMEAQVREWAKKFDTLYVCKGGTIDKEEYIIKYLGSDNNRIPVPKYFFMALLGKKSQNYTGMGFWIEHSGNISKTSNLNNYMCNIRTLEQHTGIDFFCNLPDDIEEWVEEMPIEMLKNVWVIK